MLHEATLVNLTKKATVNQAQTQMVLMYITGKLDRIVEKEPVMSALILLKCNSH